MVVKMESNHKASTAEAVRTIPRRLGVAALECAAMLKASVATKKTGSQLRKPCRVITKVTRH
jgi:hypothetical protein